MKNFSYPIASKVKTAIFIGLSAIAAFFLIREMILVQQLILDNSQLNWEQADLNYRNTLLVLIPLSFLCLGLSIYYFLNNLSILEFTGNTLRWRRIFSPDVELFLEEDVGYQENEELAFVKIYQKSNPKHRILFYYNLDAFLDLKNSVYPFCVKKNRAS